MHILLMSRYKYHITYGWKVRLKVNFGQGLLLNLTTSYTDLSSIPVNENIRIISELKH